MPSYILCSLSGFVSKMFPSSPWVWSSLTSSFSMDSLSSFPFCHLHNCNSLSSSHGQCWLAHVDHITSSEKSSLHSQPSPVEYKLHKNSTEPILFCVFSTYNIPWAYNRLWVIFVELINKQMKNKNAENKSASDRWAQNWLFLNVMFDQ